MGPKKRRSNVSSPAQSEAKKISKKYRGNRMSPRKKQRVKRALYSLTPDIETPSTSGYIEPPSTSGLIEPASTSGYIEPPSTSGCSGTHIHEATDKDSNPTPNNTPFDSNTSKMTLKNSVIKGYHVYKIRPLNTSPPTQLIVDREYSNRKDPYACLVWLPPLETFPASVHDTFTDEKRQLKLADVAGLPIGHVPKLLSNFFCSIMNEGGSITAEVTGEPVPSFPPWPAPNEEGGGVVLPCNYVITHSDIKANFSKLCLLLKKSPEGSAMDLSIETTPKA